MRRAQRIVLATVAALLLAGTAHAKHKSSSNDGGAVERPLAAPTENVEVLLERLSASEAAVREQAAWQLAGVKEPGADVIAAVQHAVDDGERSVRYAARWALAHLAQPEHRDEGERKTDYDTPAKGIKLSPPKFPHDAFQQGIQGTVLLDILIGEEGEVAHAEVRRSIPALDDAALACVRHWRFIPARREGKPIASLARAPIRFGVCGSRGCGP